MALVKAKAKTVKHIAIGALATYAGGFSIPEGNYVVNHEGMLYKPEKSEGEARLGVMVTFSPADGGEDKTKFFSMGSNAKKAFMVDPDSDGKCFMEVPGSEGTGNLPDSTNWSLYLQSIYNAGMPEDHFVASLEAIDGITVHIQEVPEPKGRASFAKNTGDAEEGPRRENKVPIVTEVLVAPWIEEEEKPKKGAAPAAKPTLVKGKAKAEVVEEEEEEAEEEGDVDIADAATSIVTDLLTASPDGLAKLKIRTGVLSAAKKKHDEETADKIIAHLFQTKDGLDKALAAVGYKLNKASIAVPAE